MSGSKARTYVLTGAVAAVTATGAWYGAGLKTKQEASQVRKAAIEITTEEKILQMERIRDRLIKQKDEMQRKVDQLTATSTEQNIHAE